MTIRGPHLRRSGRSHSMATVLPRRAVSLVLGSAIAVLPIVPPEHIHETTTSNGRHEFIAHRHAQAHIVDFDAHEHHQGAAVDDEHGAIITLDLVLAAPNNTYVPAAPSLLRIGVVQEPTTIGRAVPPEFVERLSHGPPRASSALRGPPPSAVL